MKWKRFCTRTFGPEAGVGEVVGLGFCLADLQLGLLEVLLLFLLPLGARAHLVSRCPGASSSFLSDRRSGPAAWVCAAANMRRRRTIFETGRLAANRERLPRLRQDNPRAPCSLRAQPSPSSSRLLSTLTTARSPGNRCAASFPSPSSPTMTQIVVRLLHPLNHPQTLLTP